MLARARLTLTGFGRRARGRANAERAPHRILGGERDDCIALLELRVDLAHLPKSREVLTQSLANSPLVVCRPPLRYDDKEGALWRCEGVRRRWQ